MYSPAVGVRCLQLTCRLLEFVVYRRARHNSATQFTFMHHHHREQQDGPAKPGTTFGRDHEHGERHPIFSISQNRNPAAAATADPPASSCRAPAGAPGRPRPARHAAPTGQPAALRDQPGDGRAQQPAAACAATTRQGETCEIHPQACASSRDSVLNGGSYCLICKPGGFRGVFAPSRCCTVVDRVGHGARSRLLAAKPRNYMRGYRSFRPGRQVCGGCCRHPPMMFGRKPYVTLDGPSGSTIAARSAIDPMPMRLLRAPCSPPCSRPADRGCLARRPGRGQHRAGTRRTGGARAGGCCRPAAVAGPGARTPAALAYLLEEPGDSGLPTTLAWTLPAGFKAGEIDWPTPSRLPIGPLMNHGYEGRCCCR